MEDALKAELKATCPACTVTEVNVEVPQWHDEIASTVTSALLQHPNVTVLFPDYAGMLTYVLAGIQAAHRPATVKAYLAFGGGTPFVKLQTADPGKSIIQSDIGGYPPWTGYLMFLQTARALEKHAAHSVRQGHRPEPDRHPGQRRRGPHHRRLGNGLGQRLPWPAGAAAAVGQRADRRGNAQRRDGRAALTHRF